MKKNRVTLSEETYKMIAQDMLHYLRDNGLDSRVSEILLEDMPHTFWEIHSLALLSDIELYLYNYLILNRFDDIYPYRLKINDLGRRGLSYPSIASLVNGLPNNYLDIDELYEVYEPESNIIFIQNNGEWRF